MIVQLVGQQPKQEKPKAKKLQRRGASNCLSGNPKKGTKLWRKGADNCLFGYLVKNKKEAVGDHLVGHLATKTRK